jgi:alginate O-acetyltransferase complex protein AlgI
MKQNLPIYRTWLCSFIILIINEVAVKGYNNINTSNWIVYFYPTIGSLLIVASSYLRLTSKVNSYFLFFITSLSMLFNYTQPMTGNLVETKYFILFGLSFYSLTLSYKAFNNKLSISDAFIASNPLLVITGPVALYFNRITNTSIKRRILIFFPYLVIGIFFFQIIASRLILFFSLLDNTSVLITIAHGIIFELYIYFNFAGLSFMIYAVFGIMGIEIPLNFKQPFSSRNLIEFWKGWHISLSTVLKSLFYLPARKKITASVSIFIVFICSGLWHGVTTNFLIWGTFHGLCFILTKELLKKGYKVIATVLLLIAIPLGRIIFADSNIQRLAIKLIFSNHEFDPSILKSFGLNQYLALFFALFVVLIEFVFRNQKYFKQRTYKFLRIPPIQLLLLGLITLLIYNSGINYAAYGQR